MNDDNDDNDDNDYNITRDPSQQDLENPEHKHSSKTRELEGLKPSQDDEYNSEYIEISNLDDLWFDN